MVALMQLSPVAARCQIPPAESTESPIERHVAETLLSVKSLNSVACMLPSPSLSVHSHICRLGAPLVAGQAAGSYCLALVEVHPNMLHGTKIEPEVR